MKSLAVCGRELATGKTARLTSDKRLIFGDKFLTLDQRGECAIAFPKTNQLDYLPFHQLFSDDFLKTNQSLKGKIVILGYDGEKIHQVTTPLGSIKAHRLFIFELRSLYQDLAVKKE